MVVRPGILGLLVLLLVRPAFCSTQAGEGGHLQIVCKQYSLDDPAIPVAIVKSLQEPAANVFKDAAGTEWQATISGLVEMLAGFPLPTSSGCIRRGENRCYVSLSPAAAAARSAPPIANSSTYS